MNEQAIRPGRYLYVIAAIILAGGLAVFAWGVVSFVGGISDAMGNPFTVPGRTELHLPAAGGYNLLLEEGPLEGSFASRGSLPADLQITITSKNSCAEIPLRPVMANITYTYGSRRAIVVCDFHIDRPGDYVLAAQYPDGASGPRVTLAVGPEIGGRIFIFVAGIFALIFGGMGAVAIIVVTAILRSRNKRRLTVPPPLP